MKVTQHIDRLIRSSDPGLGQMLLNEIRTKVAARGQHFGFALTEDKLRQLVRTYGEQYVSDAIADLDQYFDIVNRRFFSRGVPTHLAVPYLFGDGKQYRASVAAMSAAGEAVAGYCMEQFGFRPLVRPLGVMPDAILWASRNDSLILALTEAKASATYDTKRLLERNACQFFVDVKTRATGFRYDYEGYLVCTQFQDGRRVTCAILCVDLRYYNAGRSPSVARAAPDSISTNVPSYDDPEARVQNLIRLQGETISAKDEYLASLVSDEASRSATLALIKRGMAPEKAGEVERYINDKARELGLEEEWQTGQTLVKDTKKAESEKISTAIERYKRPDIVVSQ